MKNRKIVLICARIQVWSGIVLSVCILGGMTSLVASYYDYSEVIMNDSFHIQVPNTKKPQTIRFWGIVSDILLNVFLWN